MSVQLIVHKYQLHPRSVLGAGGGRRGWDKGSALEGFETNLQLQQSRLCPCCKLHTPRALGICIWRKGTQLQGGEGGDRGSRGSSCTHVSLLAPLVFRADGFLLRVLVRHHSLDGIIHACLCTAQCIALFGNILLLTKPLPSVGLGA